MFFTNRHPNLTATIMILISMASSALGFASSILVARWLGAVGYQQYSVAIAGLTLVATCCEFGTGKYALRILPEYREQKQWGLLKGFYGFSFGLVLLAGLLVGGITFVCGRLFPGIYDNPLIVGASVFVPTTALVAIAAEFVMANRLPIAGALITRLLCPVATLIGLVMIVSMGQLTPMAAVIVFGLGGAFSLLIALVVIVQVMGPSVRNAASQYQFRQWLSASLWFCLFAFVTSWIFRVSLLILHALNIPDLEIARFAAALEVASLIVMVAKSTNKFYQPELAMIMNNGDWARGMKLRRSRRILTLAASLGYLALVVVFGRTILGWFGPEFRAGYPALCLLTIGTGTATVFAMAAEYLKFTGRMKTLLLIYSLGGAALAFLTGWLAPAYGATGAAIALSVVLIGMTVVFERLATWQLFKEIRNLENRTHT